MNKTYKIVLIAINIVILALSAFWYSSEKGYEPIIVFLAQIAGLLVLFVEGKTKSTDVEGIDKSKVKIRSKVSDDTEIRVKDVKNESEIDIKRN